LLAFYTGASTLSSRIFFGFPPLGSILITLAFMKRAVPKSKPSTKEPEVIAFESRADWRNWLEKNYGRIEGIWLRFFKKDSGVKTITYADALDEALCYGWIDGQLKRGDAKSYLQRFTPRRRRSIWSKRNTEHVARLTREGLMHSGGLKEVESAKTDGRWGVAYERPGAMTMPKDFVAAVMKNSKAKKTFDSLNQRNRYAIAWRLHTAKKAETRQRRFEAMIKMLEAGETFH
jgi:uncharacterized protein YdeI (YjbR/CyaY-like superfamily)